MRGSEIGPDGRWLTVETNETYDLVAGICPIGVQEILNGTSPTCALGKYLTDLDGVNNNIAATLADGDVHGQLKMVQLSNLNGRTVTLTLSSAESTSLDVITFSVTGDRVLLIWYDQDDDGTGYWKILERSNETGNLSSPAVG